MGGCGASRSTNPRTYLASPRVWDAFLKRVREACKRLLQIQVVLSHDNSELK